LASRFFDSISEFGRFGRAEHFVGELRISSEEIDGHVIGCHISSDYVEVIMNKEINRLDLNAKN
jgi:hypothetical protein